MTKLISRTVQVILASFCLNGNATQSGNFSEFSKKGVIAYHEKNYEGAVAYYKSALSIQPNNINTLNNLALAYLKLENYELAITTAQKVTEGEATDKQKANAYFNMGLVYERSDNFTDALTAYKQTNVLYSTKTRKRKVNQLVYSKDVYGRLAKVLESHSLVYSDLSPAKEEFCEELNKALYVLGGVTYVAPDISATTFSDEKLDPYRKELERVEILSTDLSYFGVEQGIERTEIAQSLFRVYFHDIDLDNKNEFVFSGDDWGGRSRYRFHEYDEKNKKLGEEFRGNSVAATVRAGVFKSNLFSEIILYEGAPYIFGTVSYKYPLIGINIYSLVNHINKGRGVCYFEYKERKL